MNLTALNRDRELAELTGVEICKENKRIDDFFENLFNGLLFETLDEHPNSLFFIKRNGDDVKTYMEQDYKNDYLWCSYSLIWSFFSIDMGLERSETAVLIKERVGEAFKLKLGTPCECEFQPSL